MPGRTPGPRRGPSRSLASTTEPAPVIRMRRVGFEPLGHRLRTMKAEDRTAPGPRIEEVHEPRLRAVAQVEERQRPVRRGQFGRETIGIPLDLRLDTREGVAFLLGFERADRPSV